MSTKLDARLKLVADFAARGRVIADIGADHAKLAINLVTSRQISWAIAADVNVGPYEAAKRQVAALGLTGKIDVRLGDGLQVLAPGEVDTVCLAGMGGGLMGRILSDSPLIVDKLSSLVLQPMNDAFVVRLWLYRNGWHIVNEGLAEVHGHIYEVIHAEHGAAPCPEFWRLHVGIVLSEQRPPFFERFVTGKLSKIRRALLGMDCSKTATEQRKYADLLNLKNKLEEILI